MCWVVLSKTKLAVLFCAPECLFWSSSIELSTGYHNDLVSLTNPQADPKKAKIMQVCIKHTINIIHQTECVVHAVQGFVLETGDSSG